jgi:hypothetical protein
LVEEHPLGSPSVDVCLVVDTARPFTLGLVDLVDLLVASIQELGFESRPLRNEVSDRGPTVLLGYHRLKEWPASTYPLIVFQLEQLSLREGWLSPALVELLRCADHVWDYSESNRIVLDGLGIPSVHVPLGYSSVLERIPRSQEKPIDVLFYGSINDRRSLVLTELARGCNVESRFGCWGAERDELISRAKIVLNMHFYSMALFESVRVSYLLNNGVFVVSETSADGPIASENLGVPYESLVARCRHYLDRPDERDRLAELNKKDFALQPMTLRVASGLSSLGIG